MTKYALWMIFLLGPIPQLSEAASPKMVRRKVARTRFTVAKKGRSRSNLAPVQKNPNIISKNAQSNHRQKGELNRGQKGGSRRVGFNPHLRTKLSPVPSVVRDKSNRKKTAKEIAPKDLRKNRGKNTRLAKVKSDLPGKMRPIHGDAKLVFTNLLSKDKIFKLPTTGWKDMTVGELGIQPRIFQKAHQHCLHHFGWSAPCNWWINCFYHCYWDHCHDWCWDYWYPCSYYVVPCNSSFGYYLGCKTFSIPGVGMGVTEIEHDSPAEKCGLQIGDVLVSAQGVGLQEFHASDVFQHLIKDSGGLLSMEVLKDGEAEPLELAAHLKKVYYRSY